MLLHCVVADCIDERECIAMYLVGWDKQEIYIQPKGLAMFGYGTWKHRAYDKRTALFARSICIQTLDNDLLIFCCLDMGCVTYAMRSLAVQHLQHKLGERFQAQRFILMATHTHSAPGGCGYEALYNMPTPGFVPEHLNAVVDAIVSSVIKALATQKKTDIYMSKGCFDEDTPVAWNRALDSYNRNPDISRKNPEQCHLAVDRDMQLLGFYREGALQAVLSLFGVHATCLSSRLSAHDGDNKGYAATCTERVLQQRGVKNPVAIFAQAAAGDVSPHYHGPEQSQIRASICGEKEYEYAQQNGRYQSELALKALEHHSTPLVGELEAVCSYVDLSNIEIPAEFAMGQTQAKTSAACHGAAFFAGTPVDGAGVAQPIMKAMQWLAQREKKKKLSKTHAADYSDYQALYESQGPKDIVLDCGSKTIFGKALTHYPKFLDRLIAEMHRQVSAGAIEQSLLVPNIVPLQLIKIGHLNILCCPGEITTVAAKRLKATVQYCLADNQKVWLASYCNDYMGYVTTYEEYQQQAYEGGHTLYGQWTLAALQTKFKYLAQQLNLPAAQRDAQTNLPPDVPQHELEKRTYQAYPDNKNGSAKVFHVKHEHSENKGMEL